MACHNVRTHIENNLILYRFANPALLQEALDAGGPTRIGGPWDHHPNERLADIGSDQMALVILADRHQQASSDSAQRQKTESKESSLRLLS